MSLLDDAVDRIQRAMTKRIDAISPFRATVTSTDSRGVYIQRHGTSTSDAEPYANASGQRVFVGDIVLCQPVNGRLVVVGVARANSPVSIIPPFRDLSDPYSTTSIDNASPEWWTGDASGIIRNVAMTPGLWRFTVDASIKLRRSVPNGGVWMVISIDGVANSQLDYLSTPRDQYITIRDAVTVDVTVASPRNVPIRLGWAGFSTAGTTYAYHPVVTGSYQRIG